MLAVERHGDQLTVDQRSNGMVRILTWVALALAVVLVGVFLTSLASGPKRRTFACSRTTHQCELRGGHRWNVPVDDVVAVELSTHQVQNWGEYLRIELRLRSGTRRIISPGDAGTDDSHAEYHAAVDAIRAFLATPTQDRVDTTFAYRVSGFEKLNNGLLAFGALAMLALMVAWSRITTWRFDGAAKTVTITTRGPLRRPRARTLGFAQIDRVIDSHTARFRALVLEVGAEKLRVSGVLAAGADLDSAVAAIGEILGRPVETIRPVVSA
jgi:hypothetical protein